MERVASAARSGANVRSRLGFAEGGREGGGGREGREGREGEVKRDVDRDGEDRLALALVLGVGVEAGDEEEGFVEGGEGFVENGEGARGVAVPAAGREGAVARERFDFPMVGGPGRGARGRGGWRDGEARTDRHGALH